MMGAATEKARLPRFSLVRGIESCCEVDDLSCLGTLEKCRRLEEVVILLLAFLLQLAGSEDHVNGPTATSEAALTLWK